MMMTQQDQFSTEALEALKEIFIQSVCDILDCKHYTGSKVKTLPEMSEVHYFISNRKGDRNIWRCENKDLEKRLAKIAKPLVERF